MEPRSRPGVLRFNYHESPGWLYSRRANGEIRQSDPAPFFGEDAFLQLDERGRLRSLRVGGLSMEREAPPAIPVDWRQLFAAAGLDLRSFHPTEVTRRTVVAYDERQAWDGESDGHSLHVEAAAYRARPVQFIVIQQAQEEPAGTRGAVLTQVAEFSVGPH